MNKLKKGILVLFEGGEACGKTLQRDLCLDYFSKKYDTISMREPGSAKASERIREILLDREMKDKLSPLTELLLFESSRAQFVSEILKPALEQKKLVLCDRFYYSTIAYQGFGRGIDLKTIELLNNTAAQGIKPDTAFIFDISYEESQARMAKAKKIKDRMEQEKKPFHDKVRQGYNYIAENYREAVLIDACRLPEEINKEIIARIEEYISKQ